MNDRVTLPLVEAAGDAKASSELDELLQRPVEMRKAPVERQRIDGVLVGQLVGFRDVHVPLVVFEGRPGTAALDARTAIDLRPEFIGEDVVLMFEEADPRRPIVMGRLHKPNAWPIDEKPAQVNVDADGQRLVVTAQDQIVFKCGKASITLTRAGKVLIQGSYVLSRSSGVNRVKGGSVQIN